MRQTLSRRPQGATFIGSLCSICVALACENVLGIGDTTLASPADGGSSGGTFPSGAGTGDAGEHEPPNDESGGSTTGGTRGTGGVAAGGEMTGGNAALGGAAGQVGTTAGGAGIVGHAGGEGGAAAGGGAEAGGSAGSGGQTEVGGAVDSYAAGAAGAGGVPWSPVDLSRLVLWLEPTTDSLSVQTGAVEAWHDRSPSAVTALQSDTLRQPKLRSGAFGSYSGVEFDGIDDVLRIPDSASLQLGTRNFVVEIVFFHTTRVETSLGGSVLLSKQAADSAFTGIGIFANRPIGPWPSDRLAVQLDFGNVAFSPATKSYNDGTTYLLGMHRSGFYEFSLRLDGQVVDTTTVQSDSPINVSDTGCEPGVWTSCDAFIGGGFGAGQFLQGTIAEIVVAADPTAADVALLEGYLARKYREVLDPR